jgi:hypothetical protein
MANGWFYVLPEIDVKKLESVFSPQGPTMDQPNTRARRRRNRDTVGVLKTK